MRSVLYGLKKLDKGDPQKLRLLIGMLEGEFKQCLEYAVRMYDSVGDFPTPEMINDKFSMNLNAEDEVKSFPKHLDVILEDLRDKNTRRALLELASKDHLTVEDINKRVTECQVECTFPDAEFEYLKIGAIYKNIKENPIGCKFFVNALDEEVMGVSYGKICTIMGFVSHYKTMEAMNIAYGNAQEFGYNFAVISLEGTKEESYINLMARHSHTMRPNDPLFIRTSYHFHFLMPPMLINQNSNFLLELSFHTLLRSFTRFEMTSNSIHKTLLP